MPDVAVATGRRGAVVAPHALATEAGLAALRAGGHAVDAAIAANAVLTVAMPHACGLGGDAFWLIWEATARRQLALNGSGRAAGASDPGALRASGLRAMPEHGPLSVTVPGAVRSWADAHHRFGRLPIADLLAPAIELAEAGVEAWPELVGAIESAAVAVARELGADAGFFRVFRPHGRPWRTRELLRLPALAATLRRLATDGLDAFYGELGERQAVALGTAGSQLTAHDFRDHGGSWVEPIETTYRGVRVTTHPPNSAGLVALELLNILEQFEPPSPAAFAPAGPADARWAHLAIEAARLAMADRDRHLADQDFAPVPVADLLDKGHAAELARRIHPDRAAPGAAAETADGGTAYLAVVDAEGNAVSLIQSVFDDFGSGVVDPTTGIVYQNRGSMFSLTPGHPNELAPGKRPLHTLMPGMLFRDGAAPWVVAGSMGGHAQPQVHAQLVSALVDGGVDVGRAVSMPRWYARPPAVDRPDPDVLVESRFAVGFVEDLAARGHAITRGGAYDARLGHEHAIELVDGGPAAPGGRGGLVATTDPRSAGRPATW